MSDFRIGIAAYDLSARRTVELALDAEHCGLDTLWASDHIVIPGDSTTPHPALSSDTEVADAPKIRDDLCLTDPLVVLGAASAVTRELKFATGILLLPLRHPLNVARMAATLDDLSGGRLLLGVAGGWLAEEFAALDIPFDQRGSRLDEGIAVLKRAFQGGRFSYKGRRFGFDGVEITSHAINVPLILGGSSEPALKRTARLADGWLTSGTPTLRETDRLVRRLSELRAQAGTDIQPFRYFVRIPRADSATVRRYLEAGYNDLVIWSRDVWVGETQAIRRERLQEFAQSCGLASRS